MKCCVWASLLILTLTAAVPAETYYVDTSGNDENPGSKAKPLRTIQKAAGAARAGDKIIVRGGVYREAVVLHFSGQQGRPIVLKNYPGEKPVIQPGEMGMQPPGHSLLLQAQQGYQKLIGWITIEGLEIRYGHDGVKFYNAHNIVIRNCHIHENFNQGILGNGNRILIDRNIIAGNGTNKGTAQNLLHGIYTTGTAFTITNNLIHSNTTYGIQVAAYDYKEDSMAGPEYANAKNWLIVNNTLAFNKNRAGIVIWQDGVENCLVQNNIFYKNGGVNGILFYTQQNRRHLIRNNIFYPSGENLMSTEYNSYEAIDNKQADPCFVDADSFDFHLKAGSLAADAGRADRAPKMDFEGKPRPQGGKVDIGAYEYSPTIGPLRIHPSNPRYFEFRGKPTVLITFGEHYGAVINLDFNYTAYLDELVCHGFNLTRIFSGTYREVAGSFNITGNTLAPAVGRFVCPWARSATTGAVDVGNKFDLTQWDERYFARLKDFLKQADKRGVVVELVFFCTMYNEKLWEVSPMNSRNNVNGVGNIGPYEVYNAEDRHLLDVQQAVVSKIITELNPFNNLYYEVCNEPYERGGLTKAWNDRIIATIVETEASLPKKHLIAQGFPSSSAAVTDLNPHVSVLNFHAAKSATVGLNYHLNKIIAFDETGGSDRSDRKYRTEGWDWIVSGGSVYDHLDFSFTTDHSDGTAVPLPSGTPGGGGPELRRQLCIIKEFIESFDFIQMAPHDDVVKIQRITAPAGGSLSAYEPTVRALAEVGKAYAIYLNGGTQTELELELPANSYQAEWINPKSGRIDKAETFGHAGGRITLISPAYSEDIALRVTRLVTNDP